MAYYELQHNCVSMIKDKGFYIFKINNTIPGTISLLGHYGQNKDVKLVRMLSNKICLFVTSITTNMGSITPNITSGDMIMFMNLETNKVEEHFAIPYNILNILIVENYMLIVTKNKILVYYHNVISNIGKSKNLDNLIFRKTVNTIDNEFGLVDAKVTANGKLTIATIGENIGDILLCNLNKKSNRYIKAHNHKICNIALNNTATKICTSSEAGTLISVYDVETHNKLYQFRRGSWAASIYNITFSQDSKYIALCSSNSTVHIFHLYSEGEPNKNVTSNFNLLSSVVSLCGSEWAYKLHRMNIPVGTKINCYFDNTKNIIHILSNVGNYYETNIIDNDTISYSLELSFDI